MVRMRFPGHLPAALALVLAACGGAARPRNLVIVSLDTVRADAVTHLGGRPGATPEIDRIAAEGATFTDAWAPRGQTWPALATMLTGRVPLAHGVRENGNALPASVPMLAVSLRAAGFRTGAFLSNACEEWPEGSFDLLECPMMDGGPHVRQAWDWDDKAVRLALEWIGDGREPFFAWVHLLDAHRPYPTIPKLRERFLDPEYRGPFRMEPGEQPVDGVLPLHARLHELLLAEELPGQADMAALRAHYDAGVYGVDQHCGELFGGLRERGLLDETLLVVTADHGEELLEHLRYPYHSAGIHGATLRVPLVLRWPAGIRAGLRLTDPVGLADVTPTVLELLDLPGLADVQGASLAPLLLGDVAALPERALLSSLVDVDLLAFKDELERGNWTAAPVRGELFALRRGRWRLVWNPDGIAVRVPPYEATGVRHASALYDLATDPGEQRDVLVEHPDVVDALVDELAGVVAELKRLTPPPQAPTDQALEDLHRLGYIGDPDGSR